MNDRMTRTLLLALAIAMPCAAQAAGPKKMLWSHEHALVDADQVSHQTLRSQVVTEPDTDTSSPTGTTAGPSTSWLRVKHLGAFDNAISNIALEITFPPSYAGQLVLQAPSPNGSGADASAIDATGKARLTIPTIDRALTAWIRLPKVDARSAPDVKIVSIEGFVFVFTTDTPARPGD